MSLEAYGSTLASGGLAFIAGLMIGYFIKKLLKLITVISGLVLIVFAYLAYERIIRVDWNELYPTYQQMLNNGVLMLSPFINDGLAEISFFMVDGASAGFAVGLLRG